VDTASIQFVLFGMGVALVSNFSRSPVWRSVVLMTASIALLELLAPNLISVVPLIGFLLLGYAGLFLLARGWSKSLMWSVLAVIFAYVWLKKYTFLPEGIFLSYPYFTLGLSYIFFRVLHLLIEIGAGNEKWHVGPAAYLLYTLNFTTFISGPIQRYDEFAHDQFAREPIALGPCVIGVQLERIILGFFKVNVLSTLFQMVQEEALMQMQLPFIPTTLFAAFLLAVVYPFFLYSNFSGYIDIVIALARLMRVRLPENFNRPFSASSALEFWTRWHITLSNWLKTYVYNPLLMALMRRIPSLAMQPLLGVFCFFVTFFLIGVWHGRTSEFVVFGVLTGGGMSVNQLWRLGLTRALGRKSYRDLARNSVYEAFGRGLNFVWFAFTLFWFWGTWKQIGMLFSALGMARWFGVWLSVWLFVTAILASWEWLRAAVLSIKTDEGPVFASRYARVVYATALGLVALVMTAVLKQPAPDIVYKTF
jgi:alginate O-acetyltransferase complex protein AlgI